MDCISIAMWPIHTHARPWAKEKEQCGVNCLAQGHFDIHTGGDGDAINGWPALPHEPQPPIEYVHCSCLYWEWGHPSLAWLWGGGQNPKSFLCVNIQHSAVQLNLILYEFDKASEYLRLDSCVQGYRWCFPPATNRHATTSMYRIQ